MRAIFLTSLAVVCTAAVAVPMALSSDPEPPRARSAGQPPQDPAGRQGARNAVPGSTRTIPLTPLTPGTSSDRALGGPGGDSAARGLTRQGVQPFSLLGVTWNDPSAELHGRVQVRTRSVRSGQWTPWRRVQAHADRGPAAEQRQHGGRGGTAPLWVGPSDGVEVRVVPGTHLADLPGTAADERPEAAAGGAADREDTAGSGRPELPQGLRLDMVDPGGVTEAVAGGPTGSRGDADGPAGGGQGAPGREGRPGADSHGTASPGQEAPEPRASEAPDEADMPRGTRRFTAPRPPIVSRAGWHADESLREKEFRYTGDLKLAFVHHTATGNGYTCAQAPAVIRGIYRYHVLSNGWRDIGYNFLVDKCGTLYEGRAGGVARPVMGAHTYGFNSNSTGVAVLGTYSQSRPSEASVRSIAALTAWKLGLYGVNPAATTVVTSGGGKYPAGTRVRLHTLSGHRDGYNTDCPGGRLYNRLPAARALAASMQGRGYGS